MLKSTFNLHYYVMSKTSWICLLWFFDGSNLHFNLPIQKKKDNRQSIFNHTDRCTRFNKSPSYNLNCIRHEYNKYKR